MPEIIIETQRLILRTEAPGDQAVFAQYMNTAAVREHLRGVQEPHEIEAGFARMAACMAQNGFGFMVMQHKESGDVIGNCGFKLVDDRILTMQGDMEIGWSLREDYWRQGYAYEAAYACLDHAFIRLHAQHIVAITSERNVASWRMMEKLGLTRRADLDFTDAQYPPEDNPAIVYWIERDTWK
jgi:RimJ/RimL family protein N-acetyltransferase